MLRTVLICLAALLASSLEAQQATRPNILLVLTDDMGFGDLGFTGSTQIPTPHLDALAAGSVRFEQAYVSGPVCAPSRAGLVTGRHGCRFGFEHNLSYPPWLAPEQVGLPRTEKTFANHLQDLGYRTGLVGKWHLGEHAAEQHPLSRGFDMFFGMLKGHHGYFPKAGANQLSRGREPVTEIRTPYLTDWFIDEAIDFVRVDAEKPWFLFLSLNTPHTPLQAKREDLAAFRDVEPKQRRTYCAMQKNLDDNLGRLVESLRESGQLDDTLLVFTNDNGGSCDASFALNAPLRGQKSTLLEGGLRVPLFLHWPNGLGVDAAETFRPPVSTLDLTPTFVAAAGGDPKEVAGDKRFDGVDLLPWLRGTRPAEQPPHPQLHWRIEHRGAAIRDGDLKLLRLPHRPPELYDVTADVAELRDLAATRPEAVRRLLLLLHDWECSLPVNPIWTSGTRWARYNRELYDREYPLTQPRSK